MPVKLFLAAILLAAAAPSYTSEARKDRVAQSTTCFKIGEQVSGMNKICYYNCLGSTVAINVSSVSLCPLSIDR
jgi:hypothetical protein